MERSISHRVRAKSSPWNSGTEFKRNWTSMLHTLKAFQRHTAIIHVPMLEGEFPLQQTTEINRGGAPSNKDQTTIRCVQVLI